MIGSKILVIDDDTNICELLKVYFNGEGYDVAVANDGDAGIEKFKLCAPDIVLLDIMMPKKEGTEVLRYIRSASSTPVIMISARADEFDKVLCLEMGADDYVVKPFGIKELSARVKAVLRRSSANENKQDKDTLRFDNMEISMSNHELKIRGESIDIPHKELLLLHFLAQNYNRVYTRDQLLNKVWSFDYLGDSRTVDVHIKRLREKLNGVSDKWALKTVWGVGYKFEVGPQDN
ncbi:MAG: response regulator transcription factor [Clostridia bacterium]|nr:response regulator transcription factor [Clostridia bacterium]